MKVQEVIFRAMAKRITWWEAAEILGISDAEMSRRIRSYQTRGYDPRFWHKRRGDKDPLDLVPLATAEQIFALYRECYSGLDVAHFRARLKSKHHICVTQEWITSALQGAGFRHGQQSSGGTPIKARTKRLRRAAEESTDPARRIAHKNFIYRQRGQIK